MRFALHGSDSLPGIQIDWSAAGPVGPEVRAALTRHDVETMQAGVLRKGYLVKAILYERGTLALRLAEGHEIFLELPADAPVTSAAARAAAAATVATVASAMRGEAVTHHRIVVGDADHGVRIDRVIAAAVPGLSRALVHRLIDDGHVLIAGAAVDKAGRRLRRGETIELAVTAAPSSADDAASSADDAPGA